MALRRGAGIRSLWGKGQEPAYVQRGSSVFSVLEPFRTSPPRSVGVSEGVRYTGGGMTSVVPSVGLSPGGFLFPIIRLLGPCVFKATLVFG